MSALLVKNAPAGLQQWLKSEACFNRRSIDQQIIICLEWCMQTCGVTQHRDPLPSSQSTKKKIQNGGRSYLRGRDLAKRLMRINHIDAETAKSMSASVRSLRKSKKREFDYACFA